MQHSESIKELAAALVKAQAKITNAPQTKVNPFFKSKYADLSTVIDTIKKPLTDNGLSVIQGNEVSENGVVITTMLLHESGEWIESKLNMPITKQDPQAMGSAITYGRRYALSAIIGIASDEDDDANTQKSENASPKASVSTKQSVAPSTEACNFCHAPAGKPHATGCKYA
ncbi:MAG: ERF family protein [Patescibacteria group bacterium]|jgi:hypothetical protein